MNDKAEITGRFATLLQGTDSTRDIYDRPLLDERDWLIAPTLGALIPNWVLAIPKRRALNFREWRKNTGREPASIVDAVCSHLGVASTEIVWFEHGPTEKGSLMGCGVDYAHLHILIKPPFMFQEFANRAVSMSKLEWQTIDANLVYDSVNKICSYLIAGSGDQAAFASNVELTGSQFFRRVVDSLTGSNEHWDYRRYPHMDNIAITVENFRSLESAALGD